jgi:hypothetical protein
MVLIRSILPERLMSWFGRMRPFAVHFPIALFPVTLGASVTHGMEHMMF